MERRTQTADVLKGIAVLLMIQVHIVELFATESFYQSSTGKILLFLGGPPVAPVFMAILGYFLLSVNKTSTQLVVRGIKIFMLGMLLNLVLNFNLLLKVNNGTLVVDVWPYVFGVDILPFAGLSIICIALLKHLIEKKWWVVLIMIFISIWLGQFLLGLKHENNNLKYIEAYFYGCTEWSYFPLFPWLAYPLSGIALYKIEQRYNFQVFYLLKTKITLGILFLVFFVSTINYTVSTSSNLTLYYHQDSLFFLWTFIFSLFYSLFIHEINTWLGKTWIFLYFKWLGRHVTLVYVIQWIIIGNIATEIYKTVSSPIYLVGWYVVIISIASGLTYLILKIKSKSN